MKLTENLLEQLTLLSDQFTDQKEVFITDKSGLFRNGCLTGLMFIMFLKCL